MLRKSTVAACCADARSDVSSLISASCLRAVRLDSQPADQAGKCGTARSYEHDHAQRTLECGNHLFMNAGLSGHHRIQGLVGLLGHCSHKMI